MKISYFLLTVDGMGGTDRSVVSQANALAAAGHQVTIISVIRRGDVPHFAIDQASGLTTWWTSRPGGAPRRPQACRQRRRCPRLQQSPSLLVPKRWDGQFSALTDAGCHDYFDDIDSDVLVTVTPGLLAIATQLLIEGRRSSTRSTARPPTAPRGSSRSSPSPPARTSLLC